MFKFGDGDGGLVLEDPGQKDGWIGTGLPNNRLNILGLEVKNRDRRFPASGHEKNNRPEREADESEESGERFI